MAKRITRHMAGQVARIGRWRAGVLLVLLLLTLSTLLVGCAAPSLPPLPWQTQTRQPPLPPAQQHVHVAMMGGRDVGETFDPAQVNYFSSGAAQIVSLLYSGLFTLDVRLRPGPALATSYSVSADALRYTFHLRTDAHFAEGTPVTSADVAFSLNRLMSGCMPGASAALFANVKDQPAFVQMCRGGPLPGQPVVKTLIGDSLLTPDPSTFAIILSRPDGALLSKLAEPYSLIVEQSFVTRYGAQWTSHLADGGGQGTSGMYAVSQWAPWGPQAVGEGLDASVTLSAAHGYWGQQPLLRQVVIALRAQRFADTTPSDSLPPKFFAVEPSDEIVFDAMPSALFTLQVNARGLRYVSAPARAVDLLTLDPGTAPLDDPRLRQALLLALDRTTLATTDNGIATSHIIPAGTGAYSATLSGSLATAPLSGDVAQARTLWQSYVHDRCGGVASRCPVITAFVEGIGVASQPQDAVLARWRAVLPGIHVEPVVYGGILTDTVPPPPAINFGTWIEDYPDPQDWLMTLSTVPGYGQSADSIPPYVHDPQADALVARAEAARSPTARLALYQQAENTLLNGAVVVPIAQQQNAWMVKLTVVNFPADPEPFIPPSAWARIYLTAPASK
ncbi:MAG TPA: ABC transporter substrate-binding protein [Ktedonobacterales bacterium]|nr:ABC transporter substrate-binding protein [Ktedonobacterales bacterium]